MKKDNLKSKLTEAEKAILAEEKKTTNFFTNFDFLKTHNSYRNGKLHLFIGITSGGKSTLVRSLIIDVLCNRPKKKVLLWLSEETKIEFEAEFLDANFNEYDAEQLLVFSEKDYPDLSKDEILSTIQEIVFDNDIDVIFFDNLTTSNAYTENITIQVATAKQLAIYADAWNVPIVIFAHTGASVGKYHKGIIEANDIRGSKKIVEQSQFLYIMQTFFTGTVRVSTMRIIKHRGYVVENNIYKLLFHKQTRLFTASLKINFEDFKTAFETRNKF